MRKIISFQIKNLIDLKPKILLYLERYKVVAFYDNNGFCSKYQYSEYELICGVEELSSFVGKSNNIFHELEDFVSITKDYLFGFFSYDLKNEIEPKLSSNNDDFLEFPNCFFFQPKFIFKLKNDIFTVEYIEEISTEIEVNNIFSEICSQSINLPILKFNCEVVSKISKQTYIETVNQLKKHIQRGDIYEVNFCQEFFNNNTKINPYEIFSLLNIESPMPFSAFFRLYDKFIISASPERFMKKKDSTLISQPIKGTVRRGKNAMEDAKLRMQLLDSEKERAENVMIVDLVRNDLSRTAKSGSVRVEELFGIYEFKHIFQMISTISSQPEEGINPIQSIKAAFPPGSMTGAPKIKAMELIEKYEKTKRGVYSGAVGYFDENLNFDFNVLIRSILYNESANYLSFMVGGAITNKSDPENEYDECLLKAKAMLSVLNNK